MIKFRGWWVFRHQLILLRHYQTEEIQREIDEALK